MTKFRFLPAILLMPVAALNASPAAANDAASLGGLEPTRVVVDFSDLDLTNPQGVATLERRTASAIKRACPVQSRNLREVAHARKCVKTAKLRADADTQLAVENAVSGRTQFASTGSADRRTLQAQ